MRQAFHILKKDIRYLRLEIAAVPALLAMSAVVEWRVGIDAASLLILAFTLVAVSMIVRLIHAEAIPGDRQFWVTRPYRWTSLVAAKAAFLFLFLILPISLVRLVCLTVLGFPLTASLTPLLFSPVSLIGQMAIFVVLATMTSGLRSFILSTVALQVMSTVLEALVSVDPTEPSWPRTIAWIADSILGLFWAGVVVTILILQYKRRRTTVSIVLAIAAFAAGQFVYNALPPSLGLAVQAGLPIGNSAEAARLATVDVRVFKPAGQDENLPVPANSWKVHVGVHGLTNDEHAMMDGFRISLEADDGRSWTSAWRFGPDPSGDISRYAGGFDDWITIDPAFLAAERTKPLTLRASIYATVFADAQPPIELPVTPRTGAPDDIRSLYGTAHYAYVGSGLQCAAVPAVAAKGNYPRPATILCRAPLVWPGILFTADKVSKDGETLQNAFESRGLSYSPLSLQGGSYVMATKRAIGEPRGPTSESDYYSSFVTLSLEDRVVIHLRKPIAHFRREIVQRVRLDDPAPR